jgi:hypothetical protein
LFGPREINSVELTDVPVCFSIAGDTNRPGAIRQFAERIAAEQPAFFAIHGIDAGDALSLATRFDCGWAYRGRQALFWRDVFAVHEVHDRYLPVTPLRPFDRRGLLEVRGDYSGKPLALIAAQFAKDRTRVRELRFVRLELRAIKGRALLFLAGHHENSRIGFRDLGFLRLRGSAACAIYAKA